MELKPIEPWLINYMREQQSLGRPLKVLRAKAWTRVWDHKERSIQEVAEYLGCDIETLSFLNPNKESFTKKDKICYPGKALNVSYTEDGLKWTLNKYGTLLYYKNRTLALRKAEGYFGNLPTFRGSDEPSDKVFVEDFIPRDHVVGGRMHRKNQSIEYFWCNKAQKLLYVPEEVHKIS